MNSTMQSILRPLSLLVLMLFLALGANAAQAAERTLSFAVSGVVAALKVQPGDNVKAGTVLAVLDLIPFNARKRAADANAAANKLIVDLAEVKLTQMRELFDALSTSQEEVDKAVIEHAHAQANYEAANSKAEIAAWRLQRASLSSPFSGTVSAVPGYPGMVINTYAGSQAVIIIKAP
ncbi:MAG: biotin/lipoyl-binding protein [Rhodospirillales bacterium]|nr:biotin/lipoyl-binding protein [Rhodospirillales bacterium]